MATKKTKRAKKMSEESIVSYKTPNYAPPKVNPGAPWMDWYQVISDFEINDRMFEKLLFRETLLISTFEDENHPFDAQNKAPQPIGGLCLDIQAARGAPFKKNSMVTHDDFRTKKFLVHLSSQLYIDESNGGSTITSWVDRNLHTLEEKRHEWIRHKSSLTEKHFYINTPADYYYIRADKRKEITIPPNFAMNYVGEGANFILMRYLAITRHIGSLEICTSYINGSLCRNIYVCEGPTTGIVNDTKLDVCKIRRLIIEHCGLKHESLTLLTLQGQILKQDWSQCRVVLQINPLIHLQNKKPHLYQKTRLNYKEDLELFSRYLDAKTLAEKTITNYMDDCKEVKNMLADYVDTVLLLKPEEILDFTAHYFISYAPNLLPYSEYFEKPKDNQSANSADQDFRI